MKIDPSFERLLPFLTPEEFASLEGSIKTEGCRDPIILWKGTIIDGHHRFKICSKHNIQFKTINKDFQNKEEALLWIITNALSRRNLNRFQKATLALKYKDIFSRIAKSGQGRRNDIYQKSGGSFITDKVIAKLANCSHDTIQKVDFINRNATQLERERLLSGALSINTAYMNTRKRENRENLKSVEFPKGSYRVIYADPPWKYQRMASGLGTGSAGTHYPEMSFEELQELPIPSIADKDCCLFLWSSNAHLPQALKLIEHWGFEYKTNFIWYKKRHVMPTSWTIPIHEILCIASKGKITPDVDTPEFYSVQQIDREVDVHSSKPFFFREMIDKMFLYGNKIELFSRSKVKGWDTWGNLNYEVELGLN